MGARLRARRDELEQAVLQRVRTISNPDEAVDPVYAEGVRTAVAAALEFGLTAIEREDEGQLPIPTVLLGQARLAARNRVSLDMVLRRYLAGFTILGDFAVVEAEASDLPSADLKRLLRRKDALFDRLIAAVSDEYGREEQPGSGSGEQRRAEWVCQLLDGERVEAPGLAYQFDGWHLGLIADGTEAQESLEALARRLDRRLLAIRSSSGTLWAWLGGRRVTDPDAVRSLVEEWPPGISLAIGEPGEGLPGWRLTHRQARAALSVLLRSPDSSIRYSEVALLASMLQDDLLVASLQQLFLSPLDRERDGGMTARATLRAYFAADRQVSSTAAALGVSRQAVGRRLRAIESLLDRPVNRCAQELEAALLLDQVGDKPGRRGGRFAVSSVLSIRPQ